LEKKPTQRVNMFRPRHFGPKDQFGPEDQFGPKDQAVTQQVTQQFKETTTTQQLKETTATEQVKETVITKQPVMQIKSDDTEMDFDPCVLRDTNPIVQRNHLLLGGNKPFRTAR
jgi:hypothetical protein